MSDAIEFVAQHESLNYIQTDCGSFHLDPPIKTRLGVRYRIEIGDDRRLMIWELMIDQQPKVIELN